ncbi:hypothetical protein, partial [Hungatella hathewayi]|uniref:hypothetical protein n=1 Tax=Hungatella hathewayi TaxID=154046 RepID=UPI001A9AD04A
FVVPKRCIKLFCKLPQFSIDFSFAGYFLNSATLYKLNEISNTKCHQNYNIAEGKSIGASRNICSFPCALFHFENQIDI